jgi:hypothetical protein
MSTLSKKSDIYLYNKIGFICDGFTVSEYNFEEENPNQEEP